MTASVENPVSLRARKKVVLFVLGASVLMTFAGIAALGMIGFRVNLTPSEPIGLWRVLHLNRSIRNGDRIFICPPATDLMREARRRGYLRHGLCTFGVAPLIKTVVATSGQVVAVDRAVHIDGKQLPHSQVMLFDGRGRRLVRYEGGVVPPGTLFLHSGFPGSFDSRYFGPLPIENVLGLAQEVFAYAP